MKETQLLMGKLRRREMGASNEVHGEEEEEDDGEEESRDRKMRLRRLQANRQLKMRRG